MIALTQIERINKRLSEIEARLSVATPRPWKHISIEETNGIYHFVVRSWDGPEDCIADVDNAENADFIAAAPDDIRWLLERVREGGGHESK